MTRERDWFVLWVAVGAMAALAGATVIAVVTA